MIGDYRTGINNPKIRLSTAGPIYRSQEFIAGFTTRTNPFSNTIEAVPVREERDVIDYLGPNTNLSPTVNDDSLQDRIKNDKLYRIGASAAFYSSAINYRTQNNSQYIIDPFLEHFNGDGSVRLNSIYDGIGKFSLKTDKNNKAFFSGINQSVRRQVWTQDEIEGEIPFSRTNKADDIKDFRKVVAPSGSDTIPNTLPYTNNNKFEQRVSLGNPGKKANRQSYTIGRQDLGEDRTVEGNSGYRHALDKVNALPLYQSGAVTSDSVKNDFVKFRIGIIDNDNPSKKTFIHSRAIIDNMSDDYSADWADISYMGRGEKFFKYSGFDRTISLGWTVAAQSKQELIPMYQKLNYLASSLAPNYSDTGYMRGNLASLTIGGWCYEQPGIIQGLELGVPEESPWEISLPDAGNLGVSADGADLLTDPSVKEVPMIVKVSGFSFKPIHNFIPQLQNNNYVGQSIKGGGRFVSKYGQERFIALANEGGVNNYSGGTSGGNKHLNYIPSTANNKI